ncbi:MAG: glycosyltransferase family 4 protein [Myxococcales bacterium]|nr:glycosyltransferase family 4 protein [Myxococcales bacterium]
MKICFCYRYLILGGVTTQIANRLRYLAGRAEIACLYLEDFGGACALRDLSDITVCGDAAGQRRYFSERRFDVVSVIDSPMIYPPLLDSGFRGAVVNEVHTTTKNLAYLDGLRRDSRALARIRAIFTPSRYLANRIQGEFGFGGLCPVRVVPNCLDTHTFSPDPAPPFPNRPVVLWVGKLDEHKRYTDFLEIAAALKRAGVVCEFWLAGGQTAKHERALELYRALDRLDIADRTRWLCQVEYARMPRLYALAAGSGGCLVITSSDESFGMTAAEAMACGLPVVATRVGALPELIREPETGFLVELGDVEAAANNVTHVLGDPVLRQRMAQAARARVERICSIESAGEAFFAAIRAAVEDA